MEGLTVNDLVGILVGQVFPIGVIVAVASFIKAEIWPLVRQYTTWQLETAGKRLTLAEAQIMVAGRFVSWLEGCGPAITINVRPDINTHGGKE